MAEAAEAAEVGTAVEGALKLLQQGTDEAAIAGLLVFARHVPRPQFEAHSHRLREVLRTTKLLPRLLATEADAGAYQRLAVTILATLGNDDSLDQKAESDNEDADLLEPLQDLLVRDLVEADDDYAQELFLALASLAQSLGHKTSLNAATIDVLIAEVISSRQPQRTATAVQVLQVFCHQVSLQQTARIATALHKAVLGESMARGAVELGSLLVTLLNTHANGINKTNVDGSNNVFIKTDSPSRAHDIVQPAANAVIAALKHTSHLDAGARCSIFTLASTLCEHAGPAWPQLTTEDAGSASAVSFFLRMLGVELEVCFTDARYAWVENENRARGEAKKTETASSTEKTSATLEMTIVACVEAFTWATRFFTERLGPRAQGLLERLQWTHLPAAELLKCRDALHDCVRAMTRFVCVARENTSPNGDSLRRVEQVLARALGEYLADGTCEVMGQVEQADLGVSAASGGLDTLLYLVSRAADSWQPALSTVNVLLAAEACPCADELLHKHREQLGLALLRAVAAQEGRFASEKTEDFVSVPEAEATVLDAAELYHELGGEERTWSAGSSVRATLDSWKGPIETQDPAMRFVGLQVHGCLLYLDICQSGWQAPRHKAKVDHVLAAATLAEKYNEATLHSFVFPRLQSLALSHASRHLP